MKNISATYNEMNIWNNFSNYHNLKKKKNVNGKKIHNKKILKLIFNSFLMHHTS